MGPTAFPPNERGAPITVRVDCYAGYRGEETPRRFWLDRRRVDIREIQDRWLAPDHRYFKVRGDDGTYILRHDPTADRWEITFFRQPSPAPPPWTAGGHA